MAASEILFRVTGDVEGFKSAMSQCSASLGMVEAKAHSVSASMRSLGTSMTAGITLPAIGIGVAVVKAAADMDALRRALLSTTGNAAEAAKQFERLQEVAKLPGIGLEEAVRGSIRLQNYGISAALAEKALRGVSNAVAGAGGSAEDTGEALRQMGQIWGRQKVTMDNLRIVLERVPQAAKIIREEFGSEALADPAKALEKLGINSEKFLTILINKLADAPKVTAGIKTALENLNQEIKIAAARIGETLVPAITSLIPKLSSMAAGVADIVVGFTKLPAQIQNTAIALGALAIAAGPVLAIITRVGDAIRLLGVIAGGAAAGMGALFGGVIVAGIAQTMTAIDKLKASTKDYYDELERRRTGKQDVIAGQDGAGLGGVRTQGSFIVPDVSNAATRLKIDLKGISDELDLFGTKSAAANTPVKKLGEGIGDLSGAVVEFTKQMPALARVTAESEILMRLMADAVQSHHQKIDKGADILRKYGTVSIDTAIALAKAANAQFLLNQALDEAPDLSQRFDFKDIPDFEAPSLPVALPPLGGDKNIGPEGMMTKEQYDAWVGRVRGGAREQSRAMRQVSTIATDLSRSIASAGIGLIFKRATVDVSKFQAEIAEAEAEYAKLLQGQKKGHVTAAQLTAAQNKLAEANRRMGEELKKASFGFRAFEAAKDVISSLAQSITRVLIEGALKKLASKLMDVGGLFGKVFDGGTGVIKSAVPALNPTINAAGGIGGGAAGSASSGAASAAGGVMGIANVITGALTAASSIIGNFQFAHMNTALGRIEESTRYAKGYLGGEGQSILWSTQVTAERMLYANTALDNIGRFASEMLGNLQQINQGGAMAGGGAVVNNYFDGAKIFSRDAMQELAEEIARVLKQQGL